MIKIKANKNIKELREKINVLEDTRAFIEIETLLSAYECNEEDGINYDYDGFIDEEIFCNALKAAGISFCVCTHYLDDDTIFFKSSDEIYLNACPRDAFTCVIGGYDYFKDTLNDLLKIGELIDNYDIVVYKGEE